MIRISNLKKTYMPKGQPEVEALKGINLYIPDKGMVFILGKSGSGKTTLLNVIGGLDDYDEGEITINGISLKELKGGKFDSYKSHHIGFIFQEYNLLNDFTVAENIALAVELQGKQVNADRIEKVLKEVDLEGFSSRRITQISGGQMQRVAIARALIKDPEIILADEPTGNLDSETSDNIFKLLKGLSNDKIVIVVSHDREYAEKYADRIIELSDGEIISDNRQIDKTEINNICIDALPIHHLPLKSITRISLNNLKIKRLRLIVIILLFSFSLSIFSVGIICSQIDFYNIALKTYQEQDYKMLTIIPNQNYENANITFNDMNLLQSKLDNHFLEPFYSISNEIPVEFNIINSGINELSQINETSGYMSINNGKLNNYNMQLVSGRLPINGNEVAISLFRYKMIELYGYSENNHISKINNYDDIIGLSITPNNNYPQDILIIVGVIDTGFDCDNFIELLYNYSENDKYEYASDRIRKVLIELPKSIHNVLFVNNEFIDENLLSVSRNRFYTFFEHEYILRDIFGGEYSKTSTYKPFGQSIDIAILNNIDIIYVNETKDIKQGEIILHYSQVVSLIRSQNEGFMNLPTIESINNIIREGLYIDISIDNKKQLSSIDEKKLARYEVIGYWKDKIEYINEESDEIDLEKSIFYSDYPFIFMSYYDLLDMSEDKNIISGFFVQMHNDDNINKQLLKTIRENDNGLIVLTSNYIQLDRLYNNSRLISLFSIGIGVAFGFISLLLIMQYINMLLNYKSKHIGFLRSLGARKADVVMIYAIEGFLIAILASLISAAVSKKIIKYINDFFYYGIYLNIFHYTIYNLVMIILIGFAITAISLLLPLNSIIKKKPAEIIYKSY